jgi:hypothetical protein
MLMIKKKIAPEMQQFQADLLQSVHDMKACCRRFGVKVRKARRKVRGLEK